MSKQRNMGGYRLRASFQAVTLIYDGTWWFCETFLKDRPNVSGQMLQSVRSCRHALAEAGRSGQRSVEAELDGFRYARQCLEELLLDFEDYLRHRRLPQWTLESSEVTAIRNVARKPKDGNSSPSTPTGTSSSRSSEISDLTDQQRWGLYAGWLEHNDPSVRVNALICLIHQAGFLLDQRISTLESGGGRRRQELGESDDVARDGDGRSGPGNINEPVSMLVPNSSPDRATSVAVIESVVAPSVIAPVCPKCGKPMALRTAKQGRQAGQNFWGCTGYPDCRETVRR